MWEKLIEAFRMEGVPEALPKRKPQHGSTPGGLTANQLAWLDENIANFKKYRLDAEKARGRATPLRVVK